MNAIPLLFGVIGNPIAHSLSPIIHQLFAKRSAIALAYHKIQGKDERFEVQIKDFFRQGGSGLNITLPYKVRAYHLADRKTARCEKAQAANTLWMEGKDLVADNTDGVGFVRDISHYQSLTGKRVLVIGAGGAAQGILGPIIDAGAQVTLTNRTLSKAESLKKQFPFIQCLLYSASALEGKVFDIVVNATSTGFTAKDWYCPPTLWQNKPFCYDLAYALHEKTSFVTLAALNNCLAVDGLGMLIEQAAEAFYDWHGKRPGVEGMVNYLRDHY